MRRLLTILSACALLCAHAIGQESKADGHFVITPLAKNAVRVQYVANAPAAAEPLPDWIYAKSAPVKASNLRV
ncbi:MAG: hypothetical protein J6W69_04975, partial [Bacteroidales bacterium]|nr:hypothetical protein [Bacteroidales bacterium]